MSGDQPLFQERAKALRAIEMCGGEIVELKSPGAAKRFAALDRFGREVERFETPAVERLRAEGRLQIRRFERGGVVWGLAPSSVARAAYYER